MEFYITRKRSNYIARLIKRKVTYIFQYTANTIVERERINY